MPTLASSLRRLLRISALYLLASAAHAQWLPSPDFNGPRFQHTATALPGGGVLVTGGDDGTSALASTLRHHGGNGQWTAAAPLPQPRLGHSGTLLRNGTVLIAGGTNASGGPLRSALTYDPVDDAFTPAPDLAVARRHHTATVLRDGRVLIVGGQGGAGQAALRSAELYDPANRTWSSASQMPGQGARHHTATLLQDGRVLVVAGMDNGETATANTAVYDPATDIWTPAAALPLAERRMFHTATLLPDGRVYVAGGEQEDGTVFNGPAWIYDPAANNWTAAASAGQRSRHSATLLPDGRVLLASGRASAGLPVSSSALFNPVDGTVALAANLIPAREGHTATLQPTGQVLAVGGLGAGGALTSPQLFTPAAAASAVPTAPRTGTSSFTTSVLTDGSVLVAGGSFYDVGGGDPAPVRYRPATNDWVGAGTPNVGYRRHQTQTLLNDGRVLVAGGAGNSDAHASAEIFSPTTNTWTATSPMSQARLMHTATPLPGGGVLVAGGTAQINGAPLAHAEIYHPATGLWLSAAALPQPRIGHTATLMPDGRVLVVGGTTGRTQVTSTVFYHPDTNTWTSGPSLGRARARHTATLLTDGRVLVAGGSEGAQPLTSAEIYDPASSAWHSVSTMSEARAGATATLLPDGRVMVVGGWTGHTEVRRIEVFDPVLSRWTIVHTLAQGRLGHEAPLLPDGRVLVLGGYPPGTGNPDQPLLIDLQPTTRPRPVITNSFTLQDPGAPLQLIGTGFTGDGEAAAGSPQQAASNLPQVRLQRMDGGATVWLDASMSADNGYTSRPLPHHLLPGLYQARVFSNAIASAAYTFELRALLAAPGAPTGVAATPGNAQVTVSWQAPVGGVTPASYTVTAQPGGASCTVLHPATSCTVTGLTNGTAYTFTVTANAPGGSTSAPPTVGVTPQPGAAPGPGGVQPVPTLSQWGLLSLGLLMLLAGLRQRASLTAA